MTTTQPTELRRLLAEATPGPWRIAKKDTGRRVVGCDGKTAACATGKDRIVGKHNAELIAAAVNSLPDLLDERDKLREALQKIALNQNKLAVVLACEASQIARAALAEGGAR